MRCVLKPVYFTPPNQIRRKRLAKLGNASASGSDNATPPKTVETKNTVENTPNSEPAKAMSAESLKQPADSTVNVNNGAVSNAAVNTPFEHNFIKEALHVTLTPDEQNYIYLSHLVDELREEQHSEITSQLQFTPDMLDRIVWSRLTQHKINISPFDYLLGCYSRATNIKRRLKFKEAAITAKTSLLDEIQQQCVAMASVFCTSDITDEPYPSLATRLVSKASSGREPLPWDFLGAVITHSEEQELLSDLISPVLLQLRDELAKVGYSGDYKPYITVMENLVANKQVCIAMTESPHFAIDSATMKPNDIVTQTLLGPILSISPLDGQSSLGIFDNRQIMSGPEIERRGADMRSELKIIQTRLFHIIDKIVRSSPAARQALLRYFGKIIDLNHRRTAHRVEPNTVSSDGIMLNITSILTKLCEPFIDAFATKIDKIDRTYFRHEQPVYDISQETKVLSDLTQSKEYYGAPPLAGDVNFTTHIFFLTCAYYHYGLGGSIQSQQRLKRSVDEAEEQIALLEAELARMSPSDPRQSVGRGMFERIRKSLIAIKSLKLALDSVLRDADQMTEYFEFAVFQLTFLVRAAEPTHQYPKQTLQLPFSGDMVPEEFSNYPEFIMESPVALILYISRQLPQILVRNPSQKLVVAMVAFLRNTLYIKNPYLKAKLVEVLFYGTLDIPNGVKGYFVQLFDSDPICLDHLFHALMNFYIEVERTGTSSQFYDKFNTRYYISQIIKNIWSNNVYRTRLKQESERDPDFFVHFVALLLNDSTYLLDESLTALTEIHKLQKELGDSLTQPDEDQETKEKRQRLATSERHAQSYMQLTNQTVVLLKLFTSAVAEAFITPEIIDRLAAMLNYNLAALVGPKCRELKVKNPEKYSFNPRLLLSDLSDVYLNLMKHEVFVKSIARDGRSYNVANFNRAIDILSRWSLKSPARLQSLRDFVVKTENVKQEDEEGELELGEIPDEYLDPLMYTLMEDPVTLPSSKVNIDLSTIKSHLLSDAKDPFNREPLKLEDVIPNHELKARIEEFKQQRREEYRKNKMDESEA